MAYKGKYIPRNPQKYVGDPSKIIYRSSWERRFFDYCDRTPGVLRWASEEFHIPYISPMDGAWHRYFPDVWMETIVEEKGVRSVKQFLIEIKPKYQSELRPVKRKTKKYLREAAVVAVNHAKWEAAERLCKQKGWTFQVLTEEHIPNILLPKK